MYPSRRAAWEAFHGPALGAHTFGWHTKAIVGLFHVAMDDSGAGMMSLLDSVLRTFNFVHPEQGGRFSDFRGEPVGPSCYYTCVEHNN